MEVKEIEDHKFDDLVVELEKEIENLEKQKAAAKLKLEVLEAKEIAEPGDDEKILNLKAELELLSGLVVEREEKIKALNDEYGAFNAEFNTDLKWGEFNPVLAVNIVPLKLLSVYSSNI